MHGFRRPRARLLFFAHFALGFAVTSCATTDPTSDRSGVDGGETLADKAIVSNGAGGTMTTSAYDVASAACRAQPLVASRVYYVCDCLSGADTGCVAGADSNAGTPEAPYRTFAKALSTFNTLNAGEAVALCRGGSFSIGAGQTVYNAKCSAESPCTLADYVPAWKSGDEKDPVVAITGRSAGLQFADPGNANHDEGYVLRNLDLVGSGASSALRFFNDVDDVDLCNLTIHGFDNGVTLALTNSADTSGTGGLPGDGKNERIHLRGSYLHHNSRTGWIGAGDGVEIDANFFDYNGTNASSSLHSIDLDANGDGMRITRNTVRHSTQRTSGGSCAGTAIQMRRVHSDVIFEGNDVRFDVGAASSACGGIQVIASASGSAESFTGVTLRSNRVVNAGQISIGVSSCIDCVIENNLVMQAQTSFDGTAILAPARTRSSEDALDARITVRSNTVVLSPGTRTFTGIGVTTEGTGHVVKNNVVYRTTSGTFRCFTYAGLATSAFDADANLCFSTIAAPIWNGATGASLGTFQATGEDLHSLVADPRFAAGPPDVFVPGAGSPLRGMADASSVTPNDIDGAARDALPDVGAFEGALVSAPADGGDVDAGAEAGVDGAVVDASAEAGVDASAEAGVDAGSEAGVDASVDASVPPTDAQIDAGVDAATDAGADAGSDAGADAGADGGTPPALTTAYESVSAACRNAPLPEAKIYYVCDCGTGADAGCVRGDDANAGTVDAPFRTFAKAAATFNSMAAGQIVALCRGGSFASSTTLSLVNYACRAGAPCTMRDYTPVWASGDERAPRVALSGADGGLSFIDGGLANHDEGYAISNLELVGSGGSFGVFFYNDVDDVDLCNLEIRGFQIGVYLAGSNASDTSAPPGDGKNSRIRLRGSYIHNQTDGGWLGSGDSATIDANYFDYAATDQTQLVHTIYVDDVGTNTRVTRNIVRHSSMRTTGGSCEGAPIVVHGTQTDALIEGNDVRFERGEAGAGCWGIAVDAGYNGTAESFVRTIVRGNRVINAGSVGIGLSACIDCVVENNLVVQLDDRFAGTAIVVPDRTRESIDPVVQRVTIRSNTVVIASGAQSWTGIGVVTQGTGHVITNNVVVRTTAGPFACFDYTGLAASAFAADSNLCFVPGTQSPVWNAATSATLATFQATGDDRRSRVADPLFAPGAPDSYFGAAGSPMRGSADPATSSPTDIDGVARGSSPDLGAFQVH